ncbi:HD domain-containing protein [Kitasatospora sp. NBC_00240]|uniref:HD domain-containing protein n=1 Tax=Kitasatospora sp. NBC_00240 TaxID=2903567 RepID=UPI0022594ED7|nr:HD domain-containing protein [Kitasatospora sp. NBC_00240]MCX5209108.1 HD domain-containing protein [Kitasatospora sp. NBC_00240]
MALPSIRSVRALHAKYAPSGEDLARVLTHCEIVARIAVRLAERAGPGVDVDLVEIGALLHDIGVHRVGGGAYIRHGVLGHEILRAEGLPEELCRFASCHTGVGLTRHDIESQGLPIPVGDYLAVSVEERLVMYADKFHSKSTPPRFLDADAYAGQVARFGADKVTAFHALTAEFGRPDLTGLVAEYGHAHQQGSTLRV